MTHYLSTNNSINIILIIIIIIIYYHLNSPTQNDIFRRNIHLSFTYLLHQPLLTYFFTYLLTVILVIYSLLKMATKKGVSEP